MNDATDILNLPQFVSEDATAITNELIAKWQKVTGKTTYPAQTDRLFIDLLAYAVTRNRAALNDTGRQNLVRFARNDMLDYLGGLVGVTRNDGEDTESYRNRILLAPAQFSTAGPRDAYIFLARSVDASIIDVKVTSPSPGRVVIYPLVRATDPNSSADPVQNRLVPRLPSAAILDAITDACAGDKKRPLTDLVQVLPPTERNWKLKVSIKTDGSLPDKVIVDNVCRVAQDWCDYLKSGLGRDVVRSQLTKIMQIEGVYRVTITSPLADLVVDDSEWAKCDSFDKSDVTLEQ